MTWMDVRDALKAGKTTAIIPTGGIEPNGPWLVTGKHNYVLRANCDAIARKLGNALCAPNIEYVPEGDIEPKSGHMTSPGTISMREETFRAVLTDVAHSLKMHGFKNIIFIGDSGGNQSGQRAVAEKLNKQFDGEAVVAHVQEYYTTASVGELHGGPGHQGGQERRPARRPDHHAQHVHHRSEVGPLRRAREGRQGDDQRLRHLQPREGDRAGEEDRRVPRHRTRSKRSRRRSPTRARCRRRRGRSSSTERQVRLRRPGRQARWRSRPNWRLRPETIGLAMTNVVASQSRSCLAMRSLAQAPSSRPAPGPALDGRRQLRATIPYNCADTPNPLPAADTVWIEEMTWMDVRDALKAGKTTAIISTGGIEPNGPWLVIGKHNYVLRTNCDVIARKLGNALCAPIVELVPEGRIEPPSGHMLSPGTISLREETYPGACSPTSRTA